MQISEFIVQDENTKKTTVLHQGVLVAKRRSNNCIVFLFQMQDYYVEAYFNLHNKSAIEYRAFSSTASLSPYLDAISIDKLLR